MYPKMLPSNQLRSGDIELSLVMKEDINLHGAISIRCILRMEQAAQVTSTVASLCILGDPCYNRRYNRIDTEK